jgi:hypothetical protein
MVIAIDFDGTLVENDFPAVGKPLPGAIDVIKELQKLGHKFILLTMRDDDHYCDPTTGKCKEYPLGSLTDIDIPSCLQNAIDYCNNNGIVLWGINKNPTQWKWSSSRKVYADIYIDDQAFGIPISIASNGKPAVDWKEIRNLILKDQ